MESDKERERVHDSYLHSFSFCLQHVETVFILLNDPIHNRVHQSMIQFVQLLPSP